jgi:tetratricopeptide (TPR) repeat protein
MLSRAVELFSPGDPLRLEALPDLGIALAQSDIPRADEVLTEAIETARSTGDRRLEARAGVRRVFVRLLLDPEASQALSLQEVERYIGFFEESSDDLGLAEARSLIGTIRFWQGRAAVAEENLERAIAHARRAGSRRQEADCLRWLALVISEGPTPADEGVRRLESILAQGGGDRRVEAAVMAKQGQLEAMRGRFEPARNLITQAKSLSRELGDQVALVGVLRDSGYVEMLAAEPMRAETELRDGYEILDRIGDVGHLSSFAPDLGDAVYEQGRYDEAYLLSEIAERITIEGDVDAEVRWRQLRGKTLARGGRHEDAEAVAAEAVRLASKTDYLELHAHALVGLAEFLRLAHREPDAAAALRKALDLHRQKGNLAAEARTASLLDDLRDLG